MEIGVSVFVYLQQFPFPRGDVRGEEKGLKSGNCCYNPKTETMTETEYKRQFRKIVGVWSEAYETRSGGGVGYPDLQLLVGRILIPVELKSGQLVGDRLKSKRIRPSQIVWHHDFKLAGGRAFILVCVGSVRAMDAWAVPSADRSVTSRWKEGWPVQGCQQWVSAGKLVADLNTLINSW